MIEKPLLECPLCGGKVFVTDTRIDHSFGPFCKKTKATLRCGCGLSFTKEWYDKVPRGIVVYDNRDIYDAWNDRRKRD